MGTSRWRSNVGKATLAQIGAVCLLSLLAVVLSGVMVNLSADAQKNGPNCEDLLVGNSYTCLFHMPGVSNTTKKPEPSESTVFLQFSPDANPFFVSASGNITFNGECQCGADESFEHPAFGASKTFFCLDSGLDQILTGDAELKSIKRGQYFLFGDPSAAAVFQCVQNSNTSHH